MPSLPHLIEFWTSRLEKVKMIDHRPSIRLGVNYTLEKTIEVNLTQNGLPQFQDLYCLPLLPLLALCRVTAFVYSKFQYGMNICIKAHKYSPKGSQ